METVYLTHGQTNAAVRKFLKATFPDTVTSVKQRKYRGMIGMTIYVNDADTVDAVKAKVDFMMKSNRGVRYNADFWDVVWL